MSRASSPAASPDHRMDGDHGGRPYGRGSGSDFGSPSGDSSAARAAFGATGGAGHTTGGVSAYGGATPLRRGDATPYSRTGSSRGFGASRGPYAATHGSEHQPGSDHQAISMNLIRRCLSTVDSLYSNVQSFHPGAAAAAAARNARQGRQRGDEAEGTIARLQDEVAALKKELDAASDADARQLRNELRLANDKLARAEDKVGALERERVQRDAATQDLQAQLKESQAQVATLRQRHEKHLDQIAALKREAESEGARENAKLWDELEDARTSAERAELEYKNSLARARAEVEAARRDADAAREDAAAAREDAAAAREEAKAARREAATEREAAAAAAGSADKGEDAARKLASQRQAAHRVEEELRAVREAKAKVDEELAQLKEIAEARADSVELYREDMERKQQKLDDALAQIKTLEAKLAAREDASDAEVASDNNEEVEVLNQQVSNLKRQLAEAETAEVESQRALSNMINELRAELKEAKDEAEARTAAAEADRDRAAEASRAAEQLREELAEARSAIAQARREAEESHAKLAAAQAQLDANAAKVAKYAALEEKLESTEDDLDMSKAKVQQLQHDLNQLKVELETARSVRPKVPRLTPVGSARSMGSPTVSTDDNFAESPRDAAASISPRRSLRPQRVDALSSPRQALGSGSGDSAGAAPEEANAQPSALEAPSGGGGGLAPVSGRSPGLGRRLPTLPGVGSAQAVAALPPVAPASGRRGPVPLPPTPGSGNSGQGGFAPDGQGADKQRFVRSATSGTSGREDGSDAGSESDNSWDDDSEVGSNASPAASPAKPPAQDGGAASGAGTALSFDAAGGGVNVGNASASFSDDDVDDGPSRSIRGPEPTSRFNLDDIRADSESDDDVAMPQFTPRHAGGSGSGSGSPAAAAAPAPTPARARGTPQDGSVSARMRDVVANLSDSSDDGQSEGDSAGSVADVVADWTVEDVCDWVATDVRAPAAARAFREHGVDGNALLGLDAGDLRGWGLSEGQVEKICVGLDLLRETAEEMSAQVADWTVADVERWLDEEVNAPHLKGVFRDHDIDGSALLSLDARDLRSWGLPKEDVSKVVTYLTVVREVMAETDSSGTED